MIDFALSEEEELARKTARDFAERLLRPELRAHEAHGVPPELALSARGLGLFEEGGGLGPVARAVVLEEIAAADVSSAIAIEGTAWILDPAGEIRVEGSSAWGRVAFAVPAAPEVVTIVRPDRTLVVEDARITRVRGLVAGCCVVFEGANVREVLGDTTDVVARIRLARAALLVGLARAAWEHASAYAKERVTFGKALVQHQAAAFMLVEMAMAADVARLATFRAAHAIATNDHGGGGADAAEAAYEEAADAALFATERAVQLLGGHGYLKDHPVEKWMREARALTLAWEA